MKLFLVLLCVIIACAVPAQAWTGGPEIVNTGATSEDIGFESRLAFDNSRESMWHSLWNDYGEGTAQHIFPQVLIVELDDIYWIDCVGYLPRQNAFNGTALEYELWVSTTGSVHDVDTDEGWARVAYGVWDGLFWADWVAASNDGWGDFVNIEFEPVEARLVKFKIMDGVGGWASAAALEIGFLGVYYTPMFGFAPRSAPGTPAPSAEPEPVIPAEPAYIPPALPAPGETLMIVFVVISMAGVLAYRKLA